MKQLVRLGLALLPLIIGAPAAATEPAPVTETLGIEDVEAIVRRLIVAEPQLVVEALTRFEAERQARAQESVRGRLATLADELAPHDPMVIGSGDVTIVEFFDYRCGYCRKADPVVRRLASNGEVRVMYLEFPILGPDSQRASEYSLAARYQGWGKWFDFHQALMTVQGPLDAGRLAAIAGDAGLDVDQLAGDLQQHAVDIQAAIDFNRGLAQDLAINGTPAFVIGDEVVRGYVDLDRMKAIVAEARKSARAPS